ncbi:MAG TPA: MBL fold metallo-hydrolase, partial [Gemmataceae bacterium]|nr:MBL fold metallo-hydrolase [Gemmataceae bacterium]
MDRRRGLIVAGLLALLVVSAGAVRNWLLGHSGANQARLLPEPVTLAPGIHLMGGLGPSAVYVVETSQGLVLVDAGPNPGAVLLTQQMNRLGLDPAQVRAVLLTHGHGDHSFGAMHFRQSYGARIYAGRGDCPVLRAGGPSEALFSNFPPWDTRPAPTEVDVELSGGEVIKMGEARFEVLATPGHTPGSVCYLLDRAGLRALFTGDVVMSLSEELALAPSIDVRSPLGIYPTYLAPAYGGSAHDYLTSLRKLRELPIPDLVLPGHPRHDRSPQSP